MALKDVAKKVGESAAKVVNKARKVGKEAKEYGATVKTMIKGKKADVRKLDPRKVSKTAVAGLAGSAALGVGAVYAAKKIKDRMKKEKNSGSK